MTQKRENGSDEAAGGGRISSIVTTEGGGDASRANREASAAHVPVSNTENVFEEEQTEGFDTAPTGSGDLEESV